jgi:hypothetical protein
MWSETDQISFDTKKTSCLCLFLLYIDFLRGNLLFSKRSLKSIRNLEENMSMQYIIQTLVEDYLLFQGYSQHNQREQYILVVRRFGRSTMIYDDQLMYWIVVDDDHCVCRH